jgi:hypothetical protein
MILLDEIWPGGIWLGGTCLAVFLLGIAVGYGIRAGISSRHRAEARRRYDATGSYRRLA